MATKDEIRPIYSELQGYLAESPVIENGRIYDQIIWQQYNASINELISIGGEKYKRYILSPENDDGYVYVAPVVYRNSLGGIIARLYGEYFPEELAPFSGMPSTNINLTQQQHQSVQIEIAIEMTELLTKKLSEVPEGSKEKSFLEKVKGALRTVSTVPQLIMLIITTAKEFGLSIEQLKDLLH